MSNLMKSFIAKATAVVFIATFLLMPGATFAEAKTSIPDPILRMFDEYGKISSLKTNSVLQGEIDGGGVAVDFSVKIDSVTNTKDKAEVNFTLTASSNSADFIDSVGASSVSVAGSFRMLSTKKAYLYFKTLPEIDGMDLSMFEGRWIDLSKSLKDYVEVEGKPETFAKSVARMKSALIAHPAFIFTESGSTSAFYRYNITLNESELQGFLESANADAVSVSDISPSEAFEKVDDLTIYLTIDKKTYLPKQMGASILMDDSVDGEEVTLTMSFTSTYSAYNEKVTIKKPSKSKSFEKLMEEFFGKQFGIMDSLESARSKGMDAATKSNIMTARIQAELYYDTYGSYTGMCTGDATIKNALKAAGTSACYASGQSFGISAPLTKGYYCVDSQGYGMVTTKQAVSSKDFSCN